MFCAKNSFQCTWNVLFCMMITEPTFFLNSLRLCIAVKITAPQFLQIQVIKSMSPHLTNCFWYQALPPIGNFLTSNQSPPQYPESLYHLQSQSSILCYPLATSFLLKRWRMSRVRKNNFL